MDTKLKNAEEQKQHSKFAAFWLNRKVRAAVFSTACILIAVAYILGMHWFTALNNKAYSSYMDYEPNLNKDFSHNYQFQYDKISFYEALCITSSFYLRNTDADGNFTLSNSVFLDYVQEMKNTYGLEIKKDDKGRIYADSTLWDFYVAFGDNYLTNMDYNFSSGAVDLLLLEDQIKEKYKCYSIRTGNTIVTDYKTDEDYDSVDYINYSGILVNYINYSGILVDELEEEQYYDEGSFPLGLSGYDNLGRYAFQYFGDEEIIYYDFSRKSNSFSQLSDYEIKNKYFDITINSDDITKTITTYDGKELSGYQFTYYDDSGITLFFAPKPSVYNAINNEYTEMKNELRTVFPCLTVCLLLLACSCVYLAVVCGYDTGYKNKWRKTVAFGRWYTDILLILLFFAILALTYYICDGDELLKEYIYTGKYANIINSCVVSLLFAVSGGLTLAVIAKFKTKSFIKDSIIYKVLYAVFKFVKKNLINTKLFTLYNQKNLGQKLYTITWIFIASTLAMIILFLIVISDAFWYYYELGLVLLIIALCIYLIYTVWYVVTLFKGFSDIHKLSAQIEQISKGETVNDDIHEMSLAYSDSHRLQGISENIRNTVEKQVQSERMKIGLVTNVSHDLKTPLTSIISYIDLLKKEDLPDEAKDYVKILDTKSQKLKDIVSDVFSLAKATSGIDVEMKEIDGVILLKQVLADNQDKIIKSRKSVVTEIECESAVIVADGNKLYRVFQNLIDNALNYSLDGTRIFVSMKCSNGKLHLLVKNTASYEMKFSPEEITERFTRGDKSRTDGGNGLGLSIAKTFTEACGGKFTIELDGDVFKAYVEMPVNSVQ